MPSLRQGILPHPHLLASSTHLPTRLTLAPPPFLIRRCGPFHRRRNNHHIIIIIFSPGTIARRRPRDVRSDGLRPRERVGAEGPLLEIDVLLTCCRLAGAVVFASLAPGEEADEEDGEDGRGDGAGDEDEADAAELGVGFGGVVAVG